MTRADDEIDVFLDAVGPQLWDRPGDIGEDEALVLNPPCLGSDARAAGCGQLSMDAFGGGLCRHHRVKEARRGPA